MRYVVGATVMSVVIMIIFIPLLIVVDLNSTNQSTNSAREQPKSNGPMIRVYLHEQDKVMELDLEEYVKGVVAAEMPAEFHVEALKAQAVAARTFAVKHMVAYGGKGYGQEQLADVTTDFRQPQGQAWISQDTMKQRWGEAGFKKYWPKISEAIDATSLEIALYEGQPIHAVFHSTSGGRTASAKEVWGNDFPYLQSVACRWDEQSPRYQEAKSYSLAELDRRLATDTQAIAVSSGGQVAQVLERTESGRVDKVRVGAVVFDGQKIREKLELRSNDFSIHNSENGLEFITTGYGHGVGLCQYGANGMAKEGKVYKDILLYYYQGITVGKAKVKS